MEEALLSGKAILFLFILLLTTIVSFWKRLGPKDLIFFTGSLTTTFLGIIPAKMVFDSIVNPAVLILFLQQALSHWILPRKKWNQPWIAAVLAPFADHERLFLSFSSRYLQISFIIALSGMITWFGSPINLAISQLADFEIDKVLLAKKGVSAVILGLIYFCFIKIKIPAAPKGNGIVPLGSIWIKKGKKEKTSAWNFIRLYPLLFLVSGLIFSAAAQESGTWTWLQEKIAPFSLSHPLAYKLILFLTLFIFSHFFSAILVVCLFFPFASPDLLIMAASSAFLSYKANDVNTLAWGYGYRKWDFLKFGAPLSLICLIMELLWN